MVNQKGVGLGLLTFAFKYMDEDTENDGNGQKSMVKAFLSLEIWQPLGKLTYTMYLIHIIVYSVWMYDLETPSYYSEWNELLLVIGIWFFVASIALVLWFVVEMPMNNLVTLFMKCLMGSDGGRQRKLRDEPLLAEDRGIKHLSLADEDNVIIIDQRNSINASNGKHSMEGNLSSK